MHNFVSNKWVVYTNLTIITFGLLLFGYWYFLDGNIVNKVLSKQDNLTYHTTQDTYHKGEEIMIKSTLCKYRPLPATVTMFLTDTISLPYPQKTNNLPTGCNTGKYGVVFAKIPSIAPAGSYHLEGSFTYQVNPVKSITIPFITNEFTIIDFEGYVK